MSLAGQLFISNSSVFSIKALKKSIVKLNITIPPCIKVVVFSNLPALTDSYFRKIANNKTVSANIRSHINGSGNSHRRPTPVAG